MSDFDTIFHEVMKQDTVDNEGGWWQTRAIRRDLLVTRDDPIFHLTPEIITEMLKYKIVTNIDWEKDHLVYLRDEVAQPFHVSKRTIMFTCDEDMTAFMLKFV